MFWKKKKSKPEVKKEKTDSGTESYFLKIALLGDGAVGKTNLRRNYLGQGFTADHLMTIGADFAASEKELEIDGKKYHITFQIWDLAGQQSFNKVRSMYYRGCFGGLMVFDITRPSSFENIPNWINELKKNSNKGLVPIVILGNKYDLVDEAKQVVSEEQIEAYIAEFNEEAEAEGFKAKYFNTSALTGRNVDNAFNTLGKTILQWLDVTNK